MSSQERECSKSSYLLCSSLLGMAHNYKAKTYLNLLGIKILSSPEDIALCTAIAAQLMDLHHLTKGDEADEGIGRQQGEGHLQGLLHCCQVLLIHACVQYNQEHRGVAGSPLLQTIAVLYLDDTIKPLVIITYISECYFKG